ncbi:MAG: hypothetical protein HQL87_03710 [Magnetococcales bacterium]|nr:hypothetical protein [Magnetococcales bacterium]
MPNDTWPEWERVLAAAVHLQRILPEAVLVGGTASVFHAGHRLSVDADHVLDNLRQQFDAVLAELEAVAGWTTARVKRPVLILGSLDGIETGVRQLIRAEALETEQVAWQGGLLTVPTLAEILRIKGVLILKRNATRDYLDFVALADRMGEDRVVDALHPFDRLYPQPNEASSLQQLQIQLANPLPYDLEVLSLAEYKNLSERWCDWQNVVEVCTRCAILIFDRIVGLNAADEGDGYPPAGEVLSDAQNLMKLSGSVPSFDRVDGVAWQRSVRDSNTRAPEQ